jgi:hypothetical protein
LALPFYPVESWILVDNNTRVVQTVLAFPFSFLIESWIGELDGYEEVFDFLKSVDV